MRRRAFLSALAALGCGDDMNRRPGARNNRGRVPQQWATDDGTPLGASNYSLYLSPLDYSYTHGQTLTAAITPRVGGSDLTPTSSPTWNAVGIGGRGAFDFGTTSNAYLNGAAYAALQDGEDKPLSLAIRCRRVGNESGTWVGWGRAAATDQYWDALAHLASGLASTAKDGAGEAAKVRSSATSNLGFVDRTIGISLNGSTATFYVDGVAVADLTDVDLNTTTAAITQFRIGTTGRDVAGTDDCGGLVGEVAIGLPGVVWSAAQQLAHHTRWVALNPPAAVGTPIGATGDSMTKCGSQHGWRGYIQDQFTANLWGFDWQGSASDGNWADNQHSGYNGTTLAQIGARCTAEYGTGKAYPAVKLVFLCMVGTNNGDAGDPTAAVALAAYASCLEALHVAIVSTVATARICVSTLPNFDPAHANYTWQQAFNAGLPAIWNAHDIAHAANKVFRADVAAAVGAWGTTYYLDAAHLNNAGNQLAGAAIYSCSDAAANTLAAYLLSIKT